MTTQNKFPHEQLCDKIAYHQQEIAYNQNELSNTEKIQRRSILWEIGELAHYYPLDIYQYTTFVSIYIKEKMTPDTYEQLLTDIEEIFLANNYHFYENPSADSTEIYFIHKHTGIELSVDIHSSICKQVPTGKLIPEYKNDCSFIQT